MSDVLHADELTMAVAAIESRAPQASVKKRIFTGLSSQNRFAHHAGAVGRLTDWSEEEGLSYLARIDSEGWEASDVPGAEVIHLKGKGPSAAAIVGFVRVAQGSTFIEHTHLGQEQVYVLQGRFIDGPQEYGPGDVATMEAGSSHGFAVLPGVDLIYLLVLYDGLQVGDHIIRPGSQGL